MDLLQLPDQFFSGQPGHGEIDHRDVDRTPACQRFGEVFRSIKHTKSQMFKHLPVDQSHGVVVVDQQRKPPRMSEVLCGRGQDQRVTGGNVPGNNVPGNIDGETRALPRRGSYFQCAVVAANHPQG